MAGSILLVHSPLVGPSSLQPLAAHAATSGYQVALPDLTDTIGGREAHARYVARAASAAERLAGRPVVLGHSGAGAFLPAVAARIDPPPALVFVDAVLPPTTGAHRSTEAMLALLDEKTDGDLLLPWLDWWPTATVTELLPSPVDREALAAGMPRVPRSFYDADVPVPEGWSDTCCGYIRLSIAYDAEAAEAAERGWPVIRLDAHHLAQYTQPALVFDAVVEMLGGLSEASP